MADWRANLDTLPEHMRDDMVRYMEHGIPGGGFMTAVLCNDLKGAFGKADFMNAHRMRQWVEYMVWHMPAASQGSPEKVEKWISHSGLSGIDAAYSPQQESEDSDGLQESF